MTEINKRLERGEKVAEQQRKRINQLEGELREKHNEIQVKASKHRDCASRGTTKKSGAIYTSNSKSRRHSFRGRKAAAGSIKRVMSREKKSNPNPVGLLLSDMEIQVDGKVAK